MTKSFVTNILLLIIVILGFQIKGISQKFKASIVAGINAAQIDGDMHGGFNKLGLTGGFKTIYDLPSEWAAGIELIFSQRGSRPELEIGNSSFQSVIHLNYLEVPVYGMYRLIYDEELDFYQLFFHLGISYSRLINVSFSEDSQYRSLEEGFKDNDLAYLFGATFSWSPEYSVTVRYNRSFTYLFQDSRPGFNFDSLQGYFLSFRLEYNF